MKMISVTMKLDEAHKWTFKARGACHAIQQGRKICRDHGFRWPQDVIEWEFTRRK